MTRVKCEIKSLNTSEQNNCVTGNRNEGKERKYYLVVTLDPTFTERSWTR